MSVSEGLDEPGDVATGAGYIVRGRVNVTVGHEDGVGPIHVTVGGLDLRLVLEVVGLRVLHLVPIVVRNDIVILYKGIISVGYTDKKLINEMKLP